MDSHHPEITAYPGRCTLRTAIGLVVLGCGLSLVLACRAGFDPICESERAIPLACTTSFPGELGACERLYDAAEFEAPPTKSPLTDFNCDEMGGTGFCVYDGECPNGCIRDVWVRFDLGAPTRVHRIRYLADWWSKRPDRWELWVSDDPAMTPGNGAVRVVEGVGEAHPWVCDDGDPCADAAVPEACCPDGRDQPQNTVDVGEFWPKFDELEFAGQSGRYWYFVVKDTRDVDKCRLYEIELFARDCEPASTLL